MRVLVGDVRLFFDVDGLAVRPAGSAMVDRPTLIALHGGGADSSYLKHRGLLSPLAADMQVVYLDLRGHGRSDRGDPAAWTVDTWAADLHAFCGVLGIRQPFVLAHSRGCAVAVTYAARHPDAPAGLVLAAGFTRYDASAQRTVVERRVGPVGAGWAEQLDRLATATPPAETAQIEARIRLHDGSSEHWAAGERGRLDLRPLLPAIRCRTLLLAGTEDPIAPLPLARELTAGIPNARLVTLPGATHSLLHDDPAALAAIRAFLLPGDG